MIRHKQITAALRDRMLRGEMRPGETLPTTQQLAAQFETSVYTIHTAIAPLVKEGMLERRRNLGTVVRHNPAVLTCAGIYCGSDLLDEWEYAFYRELSRELQRQLGGADVETKMFLDMRSTPDLTEPLPELVRAVEAREIQALFVPLCDWRTNPWLRHLPVPKSFVTSNRELNPVGCDADQMLELALTRLRDQGCHNIGMISAVRIPGNSAHPYFRMYEKFVDLVSDFGLKIRNEWVVHAGGHVVNHERFGYDSFKQLWAGPERPDGVFVYPDISARGVSAAALELGVRVPDELKLVFHHNSGVDWFCPLTADLVESDTARWAAEMITQIHRQMQGKPIAPVSLPFVIREA